MNLEKHYERLNDMYRAAPINQGYDTKLTLSEGKAAVELSIEPSYFHSAHSLHGAIFFKVLDEAASFSAYTLETEFFMVTSSFTTYITRPINDGVLKSVGRVISSTKSQCLAEAVAFNSQGNEVARGSGMFVRSKIPFTLALGYEK